MFDRMLRSFFFSLLLLFLAPLALHAAYWTAVDHGGGWAQADWSSTGLLPAPAAHEAAMVRVFAGRVGRWRGIFAHHTWIVVKEKGASRYTRFDKVAWGEPVKVDGWQPDGRWYGHEPELIGAIDGPAAETMIPKIRAAVAAYPFSRRGGYSLWPGPNSNSFTAYVLSRVPEAHIALPSTAIGKDWRVDGLWFGPTTSHTGYQVSLGGLLGMTIGRVEGLEINLLGLVFGVDFVRPAVKLPGFGRIGVAAMAPGA